MRKLSIILAMLFFGITLNAIEPILRFQLEDGTTKQYNTNDIDNISTIKTQNSYIMNIYYKYTTRILEGRDTILTSEAHYSSEEISKIQYGKDSLNNDILLVYLINNPHNYRLSYVDSINYSKVALIDTTVAKNPIQKQLTKMIGKLGLATVNQIADATIVDTLNKGTIIQFMYYSEWSGCDYKLKINEDESNNEKIVFYGSSRYIHYFEPGSDIRWTISLTSGGILVHTELHVPPNSSPPPPPDGWVDKESYEYIENSDNTIEVYCCSPDENNRKKLWIFSPNTPTSLIKQETYNGKKFLLNNILIVRK